ncbi:AcrR family transcriptional regulator [Paenibacillus forsythiae]|uniref:AcrR family transcriptional regulator n=1 Tax=Paenibacillus forsythiae TaxID=365616 RepID=A0ABU3H693_9BACL|nr:TetR/AcrR family transcriptional regulator [Paenibacillus forsythiae]MDT3426319.1 AcrR family transcriptional regulator [Paenibacillus forsythiae]
MSPRVGLGSNKIVMAAAEIADEQGMEGVTLAALAARLGVRPPSLYNHIDGLAGLRTQLAVHGLKQLYEAMSSASQGLSGSDAVLAMGKGYAAFAKQHPGLYEMTLQAPDADNAELIEEGDRVLKLITCVLEPYRLGEQGELHAVRGLRSILHGFASLEQKGGFSISLDLNVSLSATIHAFLAGIDQFRE